MDMDISLRCPRLLRLNLLIILILSGLIEGWPIFNSEAEDFDHLSLAEISTLSISQGNSLLPITNPTIPKSSDSEARVIEKIEVIVTAYSSTPWETDGDPYITAAGTWVRDEVVANNYLPIGTKIRIPEFFGSKIFVVEDRMSWEKGNYHIDVWFPSYWEALNFGAKRTYIEILED